MRILFLTTRFPVPPDRGDKVRPYNFARVLSERHKLSLVSFIHKNEYPELEEAQKIFETVNTVPFSNLRAKYQMMKAMLSSKPLQEAYFYSPDMKRMVQRVIEEFCPDIIYCFHLRMAQYVPKNCKYYRILDLTDAVSLFLQRMLRYETLWKRPILWREWKCVRAFEQKIAKEFDEVWLISNIDRDAIPGADKWTNLVIMPNGVDTDYFHPDSFIDNSKEILFVGYMGAESVDTVLYFYKNIFPEILLKVPQARFVIVGANPPKQVLRLSTNPSVKVVGFAKDLRSYYNHAAVLAAPLRFVVGMQNKILEAMAMQVPVVTTAYGNEGIDAVPGKHLIVADNDYDFAKCIIDLLENPERQRKIGYAAREFAKERFRWNLIVERIETIGKHLANNK